MNALSKSEYLMFLKHPAWLWLKRHDKAKLPEPDANQQAIFEAGNLFESYAEKRFDGVVRVGFNDYSQYLSMPARSQTVLKNAKVVAQARFEASFDANHKITCITDVIEKVGEREFDLYEIKASTKVKPEHIEDLAFQLLVLEKCGYSVRNVSVIYCNNSYVRAGAVDAKQISIVSNVTNRVRARLEFCKKTIAEAFSCIAQTQMPNPTPRRAKLGGFAEWLQIFLSLSGQNQKYSIYQLAQARPEQLGQLEDMHAQTLHDIPSGFLLKPVQKRQVEATRLQKPLVEVKKIAKFLQSLSYPLQFFDYETLSSVIPPFDGLSPYNQLPFQYSLHVIEKPGADLQHYEFLHQLNTDPTPELLQNLKNHINPNGSVLVWYENFEKGCNELMAKRLPEYTPFLQDLNSRIVDLIVPFKEGWYVDADFLGSASIKNVLPVIAPELNYKDMEVSEGGAAQRLWMSAVYDNAFSKDEKEKLMNNLLAYCELDTYAMVKIYEFLTSLVNSTRSDSTKPNVASNTGDQLSLL